MLSSSLLCVCSQRLARRVCKTCRMAYTPIGREKEIIEKAIGWCGQVYKHNARGCSKCNNTGYKGRIGIHELMVTNDELVEAIALLGAVKQVGSRLRQSRRERLIRLL